MKQIVLPNQKTIELTPELRFDARITYAYVDKEYGISVLIARSFGSLQYHWIPLNWGGCGFSCRNTLYYNENNEFSFYDSLKYAVDHGTNLTACETPREFAQFILDNTEE